MTRLSVALFVLLFASGCATIVDHRSKHFSLQSIPDGAQYEVLVPGSALPMATGSTPASLTLQRGDGYFQPARYVVHVHKEGYQDETLEIPVSLNSSYWANLLITPLFTPWPIVGMLVVDPITGAMYDLDVPTAVVLRKVDSPPPPPEAAN